MVLFLMIINSENTSKANSDLPLNLKGKLPVRGSGAKGLGPKGK